jgi:hypothetical protein
MNTSLHIRVRGGQAVGASRGREGEEERRREGEEERRRGGYEDTKWK